MLIEELLHTKSCSVVGLEKNTGKTVTLNYLLRNLPREHRVAVTSIGLDGELKDQVTGTQKPEITLYQGMIFATSEKHYRLRRLESEILDVSDESTALGRLVTAKVLTEGKVMLSGLGSTMGLKRWMNSIEHLTDLILVDGALSRMSLASPTISESLILATGAAYSANMDTLVRKTKYIVELTQLPQYNENENENENENQNENQNENSIIEILGAVTDRTLNLILNDPEAKGKALVIQDFTRVFADEMLWHRFIKTHPVYTRHKSRLIGVTVNPKAPNGIILDSPTLCKRIEDAIGLPAIDLMK